MNKKKIKDYIKNYDINDIGDCYDCFLDGQRFKGTFGSLCNSKGSFSPCASRLCALIENSSLTATEQRKFTAQLVDLDSDWDCDEVASWLEENNFFSWFDNKKTMEIE